MKSQPSDSLKSPDKSSAAVKPQPSDQISSRTPKKLPHPPQRSKYHRKSLHLPEKCEKLLRFFDALDASLKLLRLRKSIPVFSKIRVMIESMSERRFTHQHLAQLKFLLPEEIGMKKVLMADEVTRCMKYDLHVTLNASRITLADRRKRGSICCTLRDRFISQLLDFVKNHPVETEIPEEKLPEPFNQQKHDLLCNSFKQKHPIQLSSSYSHMHRYSDVAVELETTQASLFPSSFRKHFSKGGSDNQSKSSLQIPSVSSHQFQIPSFCLSSTDGHELKSVAELHETVPCTLTAGQIKRKPLVDGKSCADTAEKKQGTPIKSNETPIKPATPSLLTPKKFRSSVNNDSVSSVYDISDQPSCARSLKFESTSRNVNIELQLDDAECSNILDILPKNLLQSLKEKEKRTLEMEKKKHMIKKLPKLFDRIFIFFQNPKHSAIRREALIRDLTECHLDITDELEVEEQLKLLQEIIPEWIICKLSPSGNILYSINKSLNPNKLRMRLDKAM